MDELLHLVICVDDTDDLTKATSTGAVAERIADVVRDSGGMLDLEISRHQLLLDPRVRYTSHNSSMALSARIVEDALDEVYRGAVAAVESMRAETSDPGLCFVVMPEDDYEAVEGIAAITDFGRRAKTDYLTKDEAYRVAAAIPWVALTEHGGTGEGVIGALAGAGLRISGCDGRFRGKWDLADLCLNGGGDLVSNARKQRAREAPDEAGRPSPLPVLEEETLSLPMGEVLDLLEQKVNGPVFVLTTEGVPVDRHVQMVLRRDAKPVLHGNAVSVIVRMADGVAWPCSKTELDELHSGFADMHRSCAQFEPDNDEEELAAVSDAARACPNCLYRRWVPQGFTCMRLEG